MSAALKSHVPAPTPMAIGDRQVWASKMAIFGAWSMGQPITLFDNRTRLWFTGLVIMIGLESGYQTGEPPRHFLIDLRLIGPHGRLIGRDPVQYSDGEIVRNIYVRTAD